MMKDFKSFNESDDVEKFIKEDEKFIAVVGQFYTDFTDIAIKCPGLKYNIKLYRVDATNGKSYYRVNIIVNDFDIWNKKMNLVEEARALMNEFRNYYNVNYDRNSDISKIRFEFDYSLSPRFYSKNQTLLFSKGDDSFDRKEYEDYLNRVKTKLENFKDAYLELTSIWGEDRRYDADLNDLLTDEYPFRESFDEVNIDGWVDNSIGNINSSLGLGDS